MPQKNKRDFSKSPQAQFPKAEIAIIRTPSSKEELSRIAVFLDPDGTVLARQSIGPLVAEALKKEQGAVEISDRELSEVAPANRNLLDILREKKAAAKPTKGSANKGNRLFDSQNG